LYANGTQVAARNKQKVSYVPCFSTHMAATSLLAIVIKSKSIKILSNLVSLRQNVKKHIGSIIVLVILHSYRGGKQFFRSYSAVEKGPKRLDMTS